MRWYLSGMDDRAAELAKQYGLGYEVAAFCYAPMMEDPAVVERERRRVSGAGWFHAPFAELCPCAIDPLVREATKKRYIQAVELSLRLGIDRMVIHGGFIPQIYFPEWFISQSVAFWRELLPALPGVTIALENVLEPEPTLLTEVVRQVDDPRLGLCLDFGHANLPKEAPDLKQWIGVMKPWLRHVHLHNNDGNRDLHAPLYEGSIPMEELLNILLETEATLSIENQDAEPSVLWLKEKRYLP